MSEVRVRENESLESALKRFKRQCARSGVIQEVRKREHYEKPSVKRKKKAEAEKVEAGSAAGAGADASKEAATPLADSVAESAAGAPVEASASDADSVVNEGLIKNEEKEEKNETSTQLAE